MDSRRTNVTFPLGPIVNPAALIEALRKGDLGQLNPLYVDEKGAAIITGYSPAYFRRQRFLGVGPPYRKVRRSVKYSIIELLQWMESQPRFSADA